MATKEILEDDDTTFVKGVNDIENSEDEMDVKTRERLDKRQVVRKVDSYPVPKEVVKSVSQCMAEMLRNVHALRWEKFQICYDKYVMKKGAYLVISFIHEMDKYRLQGKYENALEVYSKIELEMIQVKVNQRDFYALLKARHCTAYAHLLYHMGNSNAEMYHRKSLEAVMHCETNTCAAYNKSTYAVNICLHKKDSMGRIMYPDDDAIMKAEQFLFEAASMVETCADHYEDGCKSSEDLVWELRIRPIIRALFITIRTCVGRGFWYLMTSEHPSCDVVYEAARRIDMLASKEHCLSPRTKLEYYLCLCDIRLRQLQLVGRRDVELVSQAKEYAVAAQCELGKYKEAHQHHISSDWPEYRLSYLRWFHK